MVVENDRLYDEVRALAVEAERQALAREMHDSLAQVLAFVNTKAQAVELYLREGDVISARQQMAELSAAAREVYADIREGISALRVEVAGKTLAELIEGYRSLDPAAQIRGIRSHDVDLPSARVPASRRHVGFRVGPVESGGRESGLARPPSGKCDW
jgi:nitrate/nitrite-specific signal transduction histidine kinase